MLKEEIKRYLVCNQDKYVSGESLAEKFNCSRAMIWKVIKQLQNDSVQIEAVTNKGYRVIDSSELDEEFINYYLNKENYEIHVHQSINSTSTALRTLIYDNPNHNYVVAANSQTNGRGRCGRTFFSPNGGIYFSFSYKPSNEMFIEESSLLTIVAGISVCNVLEKYVNEPLTIKWVNDVMINNLKVCGILSEAISDLDTKIIENVIIGIGINTSNIPFPDEIKDIARNVSIGKVSKSLIIAQIINEFSTLMETKSRTDLINMYKQRMFILNQEITFMENNVLNTGTVLDINEQGNLIIKVNDNIKIKSSGEISVKSWKKEKQF